MTYLSIRSTLITLTLTALTMIAFLGFTSNAFAISGNGNGGTAYPSPPSKSKSNAIIKKLIYPLRSSSNTSLPVTDPSQRAYLVELDGLNHPSIVDKDAVPNIGLRVLIARDQTSGKNYVYASFYADGTYLFTRGGEGYQKLSFWTWTDSDGSLIDNPAQDPRIIKYFNTLFSTRKPSLGRFRTSSYTLPFAPPGLEGAVDGCLKTATNVPLCPYEQKLVVAVDPDIIPYGTKITVKNNPFCDPNLVFMAADTGAAVKGRVISFYDAGGIKPLRKCGGSSSTAAAVGYGAYNDIIILNRGAKPESIGAYPGDSATASLKAQWMAGAAQKEGLPRVLPVVAALVESNFQNTAGSLDSVGYFQMRASIWNSGRYAGYAQNPQLQLLWFLDKALELKSQRRGKVPTSNSGLGSFVADIIRPASQYRGSYASRLSEARKLLP